MSFDLSFWANALDWAGREGGLTSYGARYVRDLTDAGVPWTLVQAKDIPPELWSKAADLNPDTILVVSTYAGGKRRDFRKVAKSVRAFKRGLRPALRGDLNGGTPWATWTDRNQKIAAATASALGTAAAVILGVVATPAASAAMLAGTAAIVGAIEAGSPAAAIEAAAEDGTLSDLAASAAGAAGVDPAVVEAVATAAEQISEATDPSAVDAPVSEEPPPPEEPPSWLERVKSDPVGYIRENPVEAGAALLGLLAVGYLAIRFGVKP